MQSKFPAMCVMVPYFEPQNLDGIAGPKIAEMSGLKYQWKTDTARQHLPTLLTQRVSKMASHGGAGANTVRTSALIVRFDFLSRQYANRKYKCAISVDNHFGFTIEYY